tara:strand:+ start:1152 stop:2459 length:1308 start_codon:yes stop_codon:yes gene_type:complete
MEKKLIFLELNEINFDVVKEYISSGEKLKSFEQIINRNFIHTSSEEEYELLEPWIQWPSIHTGKKYQDHKIFRLGDIIKFKERQIFEEIESQGFKVGALSPMNTENRLNNPSYFIPDPWTNTHSDNSFLSKTFTRVIRQIVNDNSESKVTFKSLIGLFICFLFLVNPKKYFYLARFALSSFKKSWRRALFLDLLLHEIHLKLLKREKPNFSTLFLNAGAHIQHHYFFNSKANKSQNKNPSWYVSHEEDPILEMLHIYDDILESLLAIKEYQIIVATGLSQSPHHKTTFYYRLKNHESFLKEFGINFEKVYPRMSRDFLITFKNKHDAEQAEKKLQSFEVDNSVKLFSEIKKKESEIFLSLTYSQEINKDTKCKSDLEEFLLYEHVNFVAVKNGKHNSKGYAHFSEGLKNLIPEENSNICKINESIKNYFNSSVQL